MSTKAGINAVLKVLGLAGLTATIIVAPNALQAVDVLLKRSRKNSRSYDRGRIIAELKRQNLIEVRHHVPGSLSMTLTPAGAMRLQKINIEEIAIPRQKKWDRKWRMVTFDIPAKNSTQRLYLIAELRRLNFCMLQRSLWVHPYPCFEQVEEIASYYNLWRYCAVFEVSKLDELSARRLLKQYPNLT